jgi:hypothetical protein
MHIVGWFDFPELRTHSLIFKVAHYEEARKDGK